MTNTTSNFTWHGPVSRLPGSVLLRAFLLAVSGLALSAPALAQAPRVDVVRVDASAFPDLSAEFELRLPSGELASALTNADVRVTEDGKEIAGKLGPGSQRDGVSWLVIVDTSGSMKKLLPEVGDALVAFVDGLGEKDRAAIVAFNDEAKVLHPFSSDRAQLKTNLLALKAEGRTTQLYRTVGKALELFQTPGLPVRKVLVIVSDGHDEGTAYTLDGAIRQVNEARVNILSLGVTVGDPGFLQNMQRLGEETGGRYIRVDAGQNWREKVDLLGKHIQARYLFAWSSSLPPDGAAHKSRLSVSQGGTASYRDFDVQTPRRAPQGAKPPFYRELWFLGGAGIALAAIALGGWFLVRRARLRREELARLEGAIESERHKRADAERSLSQSLEEVRAKLGGLEDGGKVQPAAPAASGPSLGGTSPAAKRRTVFVSGVNPTKPLSPYRRAWLEVVAGAHPGASLPLLDGRTTLGRDDDNNIVLEDEKVSLHHAVISCETGTYWLEDLGSTNGTYLQQGERLAARHPLLAAEPFRMGNAIFRFRGEA